MHIYDSSLAFVMVWLARTASENQVSVREGCVRSEGIGN
jgi:hypothetical protein